MKRWFDSCGYGFLPLFLWMRARSSNILRICKCPRLLWLIFIVSNKNLFFFLPFFFYFCVASGFPTISLDHITFHTTFHTTLQMYGKLLFSINLNCYVCHDLIYKSYVNSEAIRVIFLFLSPSLETLCGYRETMWLVLRIEKSFN